MIRTRSATLALALLTTLAASAQPAQPTLASVLDAQLTGIEKQFVSAADAMPEDQYSFAPHTGDFAGVRTFALEITPGVTVAGAANGPDTLRTKAQILACLKASFALDHKALASLTAENALTPLPNSPVPSMNTRLALATFGLEHARDHYGQMVEYLRQNGIVPPASQGQPPANPPHK
ncbi:MAG TPA: DinB family protein [Acidobacteriaceae bacterium]|jgi:hypothetical protein|nr:DinB family protein [Acidobacteriaceae bacterium]